MTKIAIVTGGSRGIGRSTVLKLAKKGVNSIFTYHTNQAEAEKVSEAAKKIGAKALALQLDTGNISLFPAFVIDVKKDLQTLGADKFDYLVNNAGISHHKAFSEITEAELDEVYNVHFKGVLFLTQALVPLLNDGGSIVNISSMTTTFGTSGGSAYASMKGAIEVLTRTLAIELAPQKIRVNTIAPSATATDFSEGIIRDNPALNQRVAQSTLLGRVGLPEDVATAIVATLSDDMGWVNGERIGVSGGVNVG